MLRALIPALLSALLLGCSAGGPPTPSEALEAVRAHLSKRTDLNFGEMGLRVESVEGDGKQATAFVAFTLEGQSEAAMTMQYQLRREESGWVVESPAASGAGHGSGEQVAPPPAGGTELPPNHPPLGTEPQQELPPNHPPVSQ